MHSHSRKAQQNTSALRRANLLFEKPAVRHFPRTELGDQVSVQVEELKSRVSAGIRGFTPAAALA